MKWTIILLIFFSFTVQAKRRVLITAFEPFGGSTRNGSYEVSQLITGLSDESVEYVTCVLNVVYDEASAQGQACFEGLDPAPDMVISTGEGGCSVQVETRAMNYDNTPSLADNAGQVRNLQPINDRFTPYAFLTLPVADMICNLENVDKYQRIDASTSAGYFVCNNTAYHLARYFEPRQIPYGFIHLPATSCGTDYRQTARTLDTMIRSGLSGLESRQLTDGRLPCEYAVTHFQQEISPLLSVSQRLCQERLREVASELINPPLLQGSGDVPR